MDPILQHNIMFDRAVRIHNRTTADFCPTVNDRTVHNDGTLTTRHSLVDDCIGRDDQGKGKGEGMQFRPKIVPQLPQTNLAYSENCTDFILFDGKSSQFTIRSEIRNSGEGANILQIRITENAMAFQFPEEC